MNIVWVKREQWLCVSHCLTWRKPSTLVLGILQSGWEQASQNEGRSQQHSACLCWPDCRCASQRKPKHQKWLRGILKENLFCLKMPSDWKLSEWGFICMPNSIFLFEPCLPCWRYRTGWQGALWEGLHRTLRYAGNQPLCFGVSTAVSAFISTSGSCWLTGGLSFLGTDKLFLSLSDSTEISKQDKLDLAFIIFKW